MVSPINHFKIDEVNYNTDNLNYFSFSRLFRLGISLINNDYYFTDESQNQSFILERYEKKENYKKLLKNDEPPSSANLKIKDKEEKKEAKLKNDEPLSSANLKIKDKEEKEAKLKNDELPSSKFKDKR